MPFALPGAVGGFYRDRVIGPGVLVHAFRVLWTSTLLIMPLRPVVVSAQTATDSAAIREAALDYIGGWYAADAARMERALHPRLVKRFLEQRPDGGVRLTETSALELVQQVRRGGGADVPLASRRADVKILDLFQSVASVRVDAHGWIDYMQLGRSDGRWRIINVLWEIRRPVR